MVSLGKALSKYRPDFLNAKRIAYLLIDLLIVAISLNAAILVRFIDDGIIPPQYIERSDRYLPFILVSAGLIFYFLQFYRHLWQFASVDQYISLLIGTSGQTVLILVIMVINRSRLPWSVYILYWLFLTFLIAGYRILYRQYHRQKIQKLKQQNYQNKKDKKNHGVAGYLADAKRVLVYGAGQAGFEVIRDLQENSRGKIPVVILDDNKAVHNHRILGIKVYGGREKFQEAVEAYNIDLIVIAIPSAPKEVIKKIIEAAQDTGCEIKVLPNLYELYDNKVTFSRTRDIQISDLLGRDEIDVDIQLVGAYLKGQTILVTGGGGSIGSELCRQIARFEPRQLVVFDIYENNAYELANELKLVHGDKLNLLVLIGSVRDTLRLHEVFEAIKPNVVFHAAAHKHVPLMEDSPGEAVKNNIIGTFNVASEAGRQQVSKFVLISTDKAVNPTNVMGSTKRIAELTVQNLARQFPQTKYAAVRFGNVLGSNGSVVPLFQSQIKFQQKVTVTHPEITRYFMTIPEAVKLVIQAGAMAEGGEIFVLDMGQPVKIVDLARELIRLNGFEPDVDIKIEYTGLRPGEKMYEELYLDKENLKKTRNNLIFILDPILSTQHVREEVTRLLEVIHYPNPDLDRLIQETILNSGGN